MAVESPTETARVRLNLRDGGGQILQIVRVTVTGTDMFAIVGAAGNVGYSTSLALRRAGLPVRAILRDAARSARLEAMGSEIALADLQDAEALAGAIGGADAVQVIAPLRPQTNDPAGDLRRSVESLTKALRLARPGQILAISDYGAHVGHDIGLPSIFHDLEARLRRLGGHKVILRSAEHMHNWGRSIPAALASGTLPSFQDPMDSVQPTISALDLGLISADLLSRAGLEDEVTLVHAEGPRRYSASDVATTLSRLSGRTIQARVVPRTEWRRAFAAMPASLSDLLIRTNDAKNETGLLDVEAGGETRHGATDLVDALRPLMPPR